jgi:hypothetical protein
MTVTVHHDLIDGQRIAQLSFEAAQQLRQTCCSRFLAEATING